MRTSSFAATSTRVAHGARRWSRVMTALAASLVATTGCGSNPQGTVMVAMQTDMKVDTDISGVGVYIQTTSGRILVSTFVRAVPPADPEVPGAQATVHLPATFAVDAFGGRAATVRVRIVGFRNDPTGPLAPDGKPDRLIPSIINEAIATVSSSRQVTLPISLSFVNADTAQGPALIRSANLALQSDHLATRAFTDTTIDTYSTKASVCPEPGAILGEDGECTTVPNFAATDLPDYHEPDIFGGGTAQGVGASCFDTASCVVARTRIDLDDPTTDAATGDVTFPLLGDYDVAKMGNSTIAFAVKRTRTGVATAGYCPPLPDGVTADDVKKSPELYPCFLLLDKPNSAIIDTKIEGKYPYRLDPAAKICVVKKRFGQRMKDDMLGLYMLDPACGVKRRGMPTCDAFHADKPNSAGAPMGARPPTWQVKSIGNDLPISDVVLLGNYAIAVTTGGALVSANLTLPAQKFVDLVSDGSPAHWGAFGGDLSWFRSSRPALGYDLALGPVYSGVRELVVSVPGSAGGAYSIVMDDASSLGNSLTMAPNNNPVVLQFAGTTPQGNPATSTMSNVIGATWLPSESLAQPLLPGRRMIAASTTNGTGIFLSDPGATRSSTALLPASGVTSVFANCNLGAAAEILAMGGGSEAGSAPLAAVYRATASSGLSLVFVSALGCTLNELSKLSALDSVTVEAVSVGHREPRPVFLLVRGTGRGGQGAILSLEPPTAGGPVGVTVLATLPLPAALASEPPRTRALGNRQIVVDAAGNYVYFTYGTGGNGLVGRVKASGSGQTVERIADFQPNPRGLHLGTANHRSFLAWANVGTYDTNNQCVSEAQNVVVPYSASRCGGVRYAEIPVDTTP